MAEVFSPRSANEVERKAPPPPPSIEGGREGGKVELVDAS
jgi:hypothetical protein